MLKKFLVTLGIMCAISTIPTSVLIIALIKKSK